MRRVISLAVFYAAPQLTECLEETMTNKLQLFLSLTCSGYWTIYDMEWCACTLLHWQWDDQRRLGHCRLSFDLKVLESTSQQQTKFILVNRLILYFILVLYTKLKNNLYLSLAVFLAQMLAGQNKRLEQIIQQTKHNIVKDLNLARGKSVDYL